MTLSRRRIFDIIQIGRAGDSASKAFDISICICILINLAVSFWDTFPQAAAYSGLIDILELVTILIFTVEYLLRLWTCDLLYPDAAGRFRAILMFVFSFSGLVDLLSFLPFYLPWFFPTGTVAFRMFRVIRIFRLFRINAYYDAFSVITSVLKSRRDQLISTIFILITLILASSLCMYSLEHEVQPEVFQNGFSGIWWSVSTLLTVGYGDIYPVTTAGRIVGIFITFLGVGMVAIPTGILSAGFVEYYTRVLEIDRCLNTDQSNFIELPMNEGCPWINRSVRELLLPTGLTIIMIRRGEHTFEPDQNTVIRQNDAIVLRADEQRLI